MRSDTKEKLLFKVHKYIIGDIISKGIWGSIRFCFCEGDNFNYVAKILSKKLICQKVLWNESFLTPLLSHPNICSIHEVIDSRSHVFQISRFFEKGDLLCCLKSNSFSISKCYSIMIQLLSAINYIHNRWICHRDIKLENILFKDIDNVVLCDFGFASITFDGITSGRCGSLQYIAPEVLQKKNYNGFKADIWSLGIVFYCLLTKSFPFNNVTKDFDFSKKINFSLIPENIKELIISMISINPNNRPTALECYNILQNLNSTSNPPFLYNFPNISEPIEKINRFTTSRISQILLQSTNEIEKEFISTLPNLSKLLYLLFQEKEIKNFKIKNRNFLCSSFPFQKNSKFTIDKSIMKKYFTNSISLLTSIKSYFEPFNGCISNPTTNNRSIVINTNNRLDLIFFEFFDQIDENKCDIILSGPISSFELIQDLTEYLSEKFTSCNLSSY